MLAYHFISTSFATRFSDETTAVGHTLKATGDLWLRRNGLHASVHPYDALRLAASGQTMLCLVELSGEILEGEGKVCARKRTILKAFDATKLLQDFAIWCAEQVLPVFEDRYPNDDRPRRAIEAAKVAIENPSEENKMVAIAAAYTADAASWAARAAYAAADADAAYAASWAARAASWAARAAYAAADADAATDAAEAAFTADATAWALPSLDIRGEFLRRVEERFSSNGRLR